MSICEAGAACTVSVMKEAVPQVNVNTSDPLEKASNTAYIARKRASGKVALIRNITQDPSKFWLAHPQEQHQRQVKATFQDGIFFDTEVEAISCVSCAKDTKGKWGSCNSCGGGSTP